jgi:hypothetical protein
MESDAARKSKILEYAEAHPYILLTVIVMLVVLILILLFGKSIVPHIPMCKKKKEPLEGEEEIDELIESIHGKQKPKKKQ